MKERPSVWLETGVVLCGAAAAAPSCLYHAAAGDSPCPCEYRHGRRASRGATEEQRGGEGAG